MGEVYRARDGRLDRDVALKVLPPEVARDPTRLERFAREARAIAALNHPHIVTIYSTEEADGVRFLTMELVEGQTLDGVITGAGLPVARFLDLALPLADALTAAHQKQITHRDLKPGNVMVSADGRVKVLDFGLARRGEAGHGQAFDATRAVLTGEGTIVGTMRYMSPEQVEGRPLDARSDLFSLGVMFFEMLTGARPFHGSSSPALMSAILRDTPPLVTGDRADVPEALARLVARCLEKRPDDRVQTARDVYNELRQVQKQLESGSGQRSGSPAAPSGGEAALWIAVLPFGADSGRRHRGAGRGTHRGHHERPLAVPGTFGHRAAVGSRIPEQPAGRAADCRPARRAVRARGPGAEVGQRGPHRPPPGRRPKRRALVDRHLRSAARAGRPLHHPGRRHGSHRRDGRRRLVEGFAKALSIAVVTMPPASSAAERARPGAGETPQSTPTSHWRGPASPTLTWSAPISA